MARRQNPGKKTNLSQFGLLDVDLDDGDHDMDLSDDDMDFEAELAAISGGGARPKPRKPAPVPAQNLDAMIAASLQDVPSDDEDVSGDEDDPDLLNELQELGISDTPSPPPRAAPCSARAPPGNAGIIIVIQDRISNYTLAEKQAKAKGESSRARRFARGLKTLNELLKQAQSGKPISTEEVPPPVVLGKPEPSQPAPAPPVSEDPPPAPPPSATAPVLRPSPPPPSAPAPVLRPSPPPPSASAPVLRPSPPPPAPPPRSTSMEQPRDITPSPEQPKSASELSPERQQGLQLILSRKREFTAAALSSKQAGEKWLALEYLKVVKQFELVVAAYQAGTEMDLAELPSLEAVTRQLRTQREDDSTQQSTEPTPAPAPAPALVTAGSVDEALKQRLAYFQQQEAKAKEEGNSSKARRMGRITKQYVDAIKAAAAGRAFDAGELPTPPGYAALPDGNPAAPSAPAAPAPPRPAPRPAPAPASAPAPKPSNSRYEKQILFLLQRQKQFKEAAIKAKKEGNIEQAKEYLRAAKGFDSVLEAARGGLPVDLKSLPLPPTAKNDLDHTFEEVSAEDCGPSPSTPISSSDDDVIARLHQQLTNQLKLCLSNREHNSKMGNVAEANRFDHIAVSVKQDLDLVAVAKGLGETPKFHYESRKFSVVQCNTDLNENDLELTIVRGIAYNVPNPKEIDTYVRFEFPYPQDAPVSDRTATVKDTNSPVYNAVFPLAIQRGARACQRVFKRHALKLEIYSKGGWFRSDVLLGTVSVKMAPLEQQVTIHDSFPLMEGRRAAGGSLEVKLRVRTPLLAQHVDTTTHRWLVIDN